MAGEQFRLLDCRAKDNIKGMYFSQTPAPLHLCAEDAGSVSRDQGLEDRAITRKQSICFVFVVPRMRGASQEIKDWKTVRLPAPLHGCNPPESTATLKSGVHKGGFSKGGFSNNKNNNNNNNNNNDNIIIITHKLLNPPLLNPPL